MNYDDPRLRDRLAAEYVLGTLRGAARRRFERLLAEDRDIGREVAGWEARLAPLLESLPPVEPPARVWDAVEREIGPRPTRSLRRWLWLPLAVAAALLLYLGRPPEPGLPSGAVAELRGAAERPAWRIRVAGTRILAVEAVDPPRLPPEKSFELWVIASGEPPQSLGVLPDSGDATIVVPTPLQAKLRGAATLAVSLEPRGGSTTGAPTGPVLLQAPWTRPG